MIEPLPPEAHTSSSPAPPPAESIGLSEWNSPAPPPPPVLARVPHLGHAALFGVTIFILLLLSQGVAAGLLLMHTGGRKSGLDQVLPGLMNPKIQLATLGATYIVSLLTAWAFFPLMWKRGFAIGLQWNAAAARKYALRIIPAGVVLSIAVQALQTVLTPPKSAPIEEFFKTQSDVWLIVAFGTLLAPLTEEIIFRGFLLPALAIAFDWISLKRNADAYQAWITTDTLSTPALVVSGLISSACFAAIHAAQIGYAWRSVAVLMVVSWVLTAVRVRLKSVAASTLLHATYNFTIFFVLFIQTGAFRHLDKMKD
ncbi:hypothetical protein SAMN05421770_103202 [Granulicella rosea]|uniref:CAAX prenyl protease 2/Lysostaphin resistance protein A-like domain-containing protein n=1 Tax=Granulicella rosea TaxID=474952 RepID=A0A239INH4_9BACT|nr:CPBP family intramembrane glutamic endopeptidase [Granulicella rosea]SNS95210.1 hypothetical protein SAMN05421770_103202 [Granulicella rosea]